jgi:hypothetical protein
MLNEAFMTLRHTRATEDGGRMLGPEWGKFADGADRERP